MSEAARMARGQRRFYTRRPTGEMRIRCTGETGIAGIEPGTENDGMVHVAGLYSTTLALAGLDVPAQFSNRESSVAPDAVSLAPALFEGAAESYELYDLVHDPLEEYPLAELESCARY